MHYRTALYAAVLAAALTLTACSGGAGSSDPKSEPPSTVAPATQSPAMASSTPTPPPAPSQSSSVGTQSTAPAPTPETATAPQPTPDSAPREQTIPPATAPKAPVSDGPVARSSTPGGVYADRITRIIFRITPGEDGKSSVSMQVDWPLFSQPGDANPAQITYGYLPYPAASAGHSTGSLEEARAFAGRPVLLPTTAEGREMYLSRHLDQGGNVMATQIAIPMNDFAARYYHGVETQVELRFGNNFRVVTQEGETNGMRSFKISAIQPNGKVQPMLFLHDGTWFYQLHSPAGSMNDLLGFVDTLK